MSNPNKIKGDSFERSIRDHLAAYGVTVERTRAGYARDAGDLHIGRDGTKPRAILSAKNRRTWAVAQWLRELEAQRIEARAVHGALVIKRPGVSDPGQQYVVMTVNDWRWLAEEADLIGTDQAIAPPSCGHWVPGEDGQVICTPLLGCATCHEN